MSVDCPIPCNICGSTDIDVIADRDRHGGPLRTTICRRCGLVWSNPRPSEQELRTFYTREYRLAYKGRATPSMRQIARSARGATDRCRALMSLMRSTRGLPPRGRVLDVGAGGGEVVYALRKLGFDAKGLEPDEAFARHAREVLDVPVETGFVQDLAWEPKQFDLITMYHALEHVEDPVAILSTLCSWLRDDGRLVVEVPNVVARAMSPAHRFHFAHLYNFNRVTLEEAGRRAGLSPRQTTTSPDEGNLIAVFEPKQVPASDVDLLRQNYERVARAIRTYRATNYYLSGVPYRGPFSRLSSYIIDWTAARRASGPREVLDNVIGRAGLLPPSNH